jgi:hypothetical protein
MQKHSVAHTLHAKIKQGLQKGGASTANPEIEHHHGEAYTWSSSMAVVLIANPLRQPIHNGLVEGADKGFYFIL